MIERDETAPRWVPWLAFLFPALLFLPALHGTFLLDDVPIILKSGPVKTFDLGAILGNGYWTNVTEIQGIDGAKMAIYRPLTTLSLALSYQLWGENATCFRLENVLLHALAAWLVYVLLHRISRSWPAALCGALVFGALPVHVEAVCGVVLRNELLAASLSCAALIAYSGGRSWLAGLAFLLALLAKESAIGLPFVAVALDRVFLRERSFAWSTLARRTTPCALAIALYLGLRLAVLGRLTVAAGPTYFANVPTLDVWLTMARFATQEYLGALTLGWPLVFDYSLASFDFATTRDPIAWVLLIAWCATGVASVWFTFRHGNAWAFCAFAFLILIGPTSNVLTRIGVIGATRLLYLPSLAWAFAATLAFRRLANRRLAWTAAALVVLGYGARTLTKIPAWTDETSLCEDILVSAPDNALANLTLGNERLRPVLARETEGEETRRLANDAFFHLSLGLQVLPVEWARYHRALEIAGIEVHRETELLKTLVWITWPSVARERTAEIGRVGVLDEAFVQAFERAIDALPIPARQHPFFLDHHLRKAVLGLLFHFVAIEHALDVLESGTLSYAEIDALKGKVTSRHVERFRAILDDLAKTPVPGLQEHARPVVRVLLPRFQNDLGRRFARLQ